MIRARLVATLAALITVAGALPACGSAAPQQKPQQQPRAASPAPSARPSDPAPADGKVHADLVQAVPANEPLRVEMWGDSIGMQAAPYFNFLLGISKKATGRTHVFPGTALCDWLPDIRRELDPADPTAFRPQALVLEFTGVAYTPCMRNANGVSLAGQAIISKYAADAVIAIDMARKAHVPIYFVSTPIYRKDAARYVGDTPLGVMFAKLAAKYAGGRVRFIDAALSVEWHGHYTDTLPCLRFEHCTGRWPDGTPTVVVREADGGHFCTAPEVQTSWLPVCEAPSPGAMRYAGAMTSRVLRDFHRS